MKDRVEFLQTKNVHHHGPLFEGLQDVFDQEHWTSILTWCGVIPGDPSDFGKFWDAYVLEVHGRTVGICGLYSHKLHDNSSLWLGWFGVLPQYRSMGIGKVAMEFMEVEARKAGGNMLFVHVQDEGAIRFYTRSGFIPVDTDLAKLDPDMKGYINSPEDRIMSKSLYL